MHDRLAITISAVLCLKAKVSWEVLRHHHLQLLVYRCLAEGLAEVLLEVLVKDRCSEEEDLLGRYDGELRGSSQRKRVVLRAMSPCL